MAKSNQIESINDIAGIDMSMLPDESKTIGVDINGKHYDIPMMISYDLGLYFIENKDRYDACTNEDGTFKISKESLSFLYDVMCELIKEQDPETITPEYIKKHLSIPKAVVLGIKMLVPLLQMQQSFNIK